MPNKPGKPEIDNAGRFVDQGTGVLVPSTYRRHAQTTVYTMDGAERPDGYAGGLRLNRDPETLAVKWFTKGTGYDDIVNQAIVDGNVANVGVSPVVQPEISSMVRRQQDQATTASFELTGRKTPFTKAQEAISRFNDAPLGISDAIQLIVHHMRTFNRGCPIATVPLVYDMNAWEGYGMRAIPILASGQKESKAKRFYLDVDWSVMGTPVPFIPDPLDLEPTGVIEWPYWYHAQKDNKRDTWVLLHQSHIIPMLPGVTSSPGIGTSSAWICLGFLAEAILAMDERIEKKINALADGIIFINGIDQSGQFVMEGMQTQREQNRNLGNVANKGYTILTSPEPGGVDFAQITFRQPDGTTYQEQQEHIENVIAHAFGEPLSSLVTRGGVGYGAQAEVIADNSSEVGVGALLHKVALVMGTIYPRVAVTVSRVDNRAKRNNITSFRDMSQAFRNMPGVFTREEQRAIVQRDLFPIPEGDVVSANPDDNADDIDQAADNNGDEGAAEESTGAGQEAAAIRTPYNLATLFEEGGVTITDEDIDESVELARERIDNRLAEMMEAETVEE